MADVLLLAPLSKAAFPQHIHPPHHTFHDPQEQLAQGLEWHNSNFNFPSLRINSGNLVLNARILKDSNYTQLILLSLYNLKLTPASH